MLARILRPSTAGYKLLPTSISDLSLETKSSPPGSSPPSPSRCSTWLPGTSSRPSHAPCGSSTCCKWARALPRQSRVGYAALIGLVVLLVRCTIMAILYPDPRYVILPPDRYLHVLSETAMMHLPSGSVRDDALRNLQELSFFNPHVSASWPFNPGNEPPKPQLVAPNTLFSSDVAPPKDGWYEKWRKHGFEAVYFDDASADEWVRAELAGTTLADVYFDMPRRIMKVDMLRDLLLLVKGGTWSDMDTIPIMSRQNWTDGVVPLSVYRGGDWQGPPQPVRIIVGVEDERKTIFSQWFLLGQAIQRRLQLVQWTLHSTPGHPIVLDALRRMIEGREFYRAHQRLAERERLRSGWAWNERGPSPFQRAIDRLPPLKESFEAAGDVDEPPIPEPWMHFSRSWVWSQGRWRLGWEPTNVIEWTGPGIWTDAVFSYVYATQGVRPEDVAMIDRPVQVGDVVFLPRAGFGASPWRQTSDSRLVHLYRGSWKSG